MQSRFNPAKILRTVLENDVCHDLSFATEFAVLGYLDIARELVALVDKVAPLQRKHRNNSSSPLWLIWELTGVWPEGEEAYVWTWGKEDKNKSARDVVSEISAQWEARSWEMAGFKEKSVHVYDETRLRSCVETLKKFTGEIMNVPDEATTGSGWIRVSKVAVLVKGLEIAIHMKDARMPYTDEGLPGVDQVMSWIAKELNAKWMITYLIQSDQACTCLEDGSLARAIGVRDEKVRELGGRVINTFKTRYEKGAQRSEMWSKSVEELVQIITHNTVSNPTAQKDWDEIYGHIEGRAPPTTILKDPLPWNDIAALEARLEVTLPDDYKDFLAFTNGMDNSWGGIIFDPPLFPASKVAWIGEDQTYFTDLHSIDFLADLSQSLVWSLYKPGDREDWPKVGVPLQLGSQDIDEVWLLPPSKVKEVITFYLDIRERSSENRAAIEKAMKSWAGSVEEFKKLDWCIMTWASGGAASMECFPSFKGFLVHKAESSSEENREGACEERFAFSCC